MHLYSIDNVQCNGWLLTSTFWFSWYWKQKKKLFNSLLDWQSLRYRDGIISVGSVNWKNIATNFSSYAKDNYGSFPFISAYGTISKMTEMNYQKIIIKMDYDRMEKYIKTTNDSVSSKTKYHTCLIFAEPVNLHHDNGTYITSSK